MDGFNGSCSLEVEDALDLSVCGSPWYNRTGWLDVKRQLTLSIWQSCWRPVCVELGQASLDTIEVAPLQHGVSSRQQKKRTKHKWQWPITVYYEVHSHTVWTWWNSLINWKPVKELSKPSCWVQYKKGTNSCVQKCLGTPRSNFCWLCAQLPLAVCLLLRIILNKRQLLEKVIWCHVTYLST